jgi:hypothetical protein
MTNQTQKTTRPNVIRKSSRHHKNFEHYITQYAKANDLPMSGQVWQAALAAARRLDYTQNRDANPKMRLVASEPSFLSRVLGRFRRRRQRVHLTELDDIRAFLQQAPEAAVQQSSFLWGPLRHGFGTWVIAILRPGGQQKGSRPTPPRLKDAPGWLLLLARRGLNGKVLYVRGHLLHDYPGGAGIDFNEAILTAAVRGDFGANHANWVHRYLVEGQLLWAYDNMHGLFGTVSEIYYEVVADYNRQPREGTEELRKIVIAYKEAAARARAKLAVDSKRAEPTHQDVWGELTDQPPSPDWLDAFVAVAAKNGETWRRVHRRMEENQQLWEFEDINVPLALDIRYSIMENGRLKGPFSERVPIVLPFSLAARFEA